MKLQKKKDEFFSLSGDAPFLMKSEKILSFLDALAVKFSLRDRFFEVSVSFVDEEEIRELNQLYRQTDAPTDILTFSVPGPVSSMDIGDIYLCSMCFHDDFSLGSEERLCYFLISHGILHLLGWTHDNEEDFDRMMAVQRNLLEEFSGLIA